MVCQPHLSLSLIVWTYILFVQAKLECVQALLRNGADVNALNDFGETALFWAVKKTALDVVRLLLDHNADPDVTNSKGEVAVQKAWFLYSLQFDCDDDMKIMNLLCESSPHLPWNSSEKVYSFCMIGNAYNSCHSNVIGNRSGWEI